MNRVQDVSNNLTLYKHILLLYSCVSRSTLQLSFEIKRREGIISDDRDRDLLFEEEDADRLRQGSERVDYALFSHAIAFGQGRRLEYHTPTTTVTACKSYLNWRCQVYPLAGPAHYSQLRGAGGK